MVAVNYEQRMMALKEQLDWLRREAVQLDEQNQIVLHTYFILSFKFLTINAIYSF